MKKCLLTALLFFAFTTSYASLMIYELYAHGGNSGARYNNNFLVIYNSGPGAESLLGKPLQYTSAASSSWDKLDFPNVTIPAVSFFLVVATTTAGVVTPVRSLTPAGSKQFGLETSAFSSSSFSTTSGKIALTDYISLTTSSPTSDVTDSLHLIDFLGYGSPSDSEGTPALAPTSASVIYRQNANDTDVNSTDFVRSTDNSLTLSSVSFPVHLLHFYAPIIKHTGK